MKKPLSAGKRMRGVEANKKAAAEHHSVNHTFPDYLRMVGADYRESGREATAMDYEQAAGMIEVLATYLPSSVPCEHDEKDRKLWCTRCSAIQRLKDQISGKERL